MYHPRKYGKGVITKVIDDEFVEFQSGYCTVTVQKVNLEPLYTKEQMSKAIEMAKEGTIGYFSPDSPSYYFDHSEADIFKLLEENY